jgi:hypothetical protein
VEGHRHLARAVALSVVCFSLLADPAAAFRRGEAKSSSQGVDVIITSRDEASQHAPAGHSSSSCDWSATPYYDANVGPPPEAGARPSLDHELYLVFCDGAFVGVYWLGPRNFPGPDVEAMAGEVVDHVPVDLATIKARPADRAVTGIPSYFWTDGYRGEEITDTVDGFGVSVHVSITLGTVEWDFGDGTPHLTGSLGEPWPARSSVHHTYRDKGAHTVTVTITLPATFQVDGGPAQALPPVVRTATLAYDVDEVQAVRDR